MPAGGLFDDDIGNDAAKAVEDTCVVQLAPGVLRSRAIAVSHPFGIATRLPAIQSLPVACTSYRSLAVAFAQHCQQDAFIMSVENRLPAPGETVFGISGMLAGKEITATTVKGPFLMETMRQGGARSTSTFYPEEARGASPALSV